MKRTISALGLVLIANLAIAQTQKMDSMRTAPPVVKELSRDSGRYKMPVQKMDTMKNNMPTVKPDKMKQAK